jgi:hypothetical protein
MELTRDYLERRKQELLIGRHQLDGAIDFLAELFEILDAESEAGDKPPASDLPVT